MLATTTIFFTAISVPYYIEQTQGISLDSTSARMLLGCYWL